MHFFVTHDHKTITDAVVAAANCALYNYHFTMLSHKGDEVIELVCRSSSAGDVVFWTIFSAFICLPGDQRPKNLNFLRVLVQIET